MEREIRKIIHVDMDAFYASVEQRDDPTLKGKPVAVGGSGRRGVVMTASYEARKFGVHSAMPSIRARQLCRDLIFVRPRFDAYKEASTCMREVFREFTSLVEPLSLDEAFLDVTNPKLGPPSGTLIAREIKRRIAEQTNLSCSAGVAPNKFLAKVASGMQKPDGLTVILPGNVLDFIDRLPIEKFFGVGPATAKKFQRLDINCGADLRSRSREELVRNFGKSGDWYYRIARGIDTRPVSARHERKSLSAERTFSEDINSLDEMEEKLREITAEVARRMRKSDLRARAVTVKIKDQNFVISTRSKTLSREIASAAEIWRVACTLLKENQPENPVRLLGISLGKLRSLKSPGTQIQLDLDEE